VLAYHICAIAKPRSLCNGVDNHVLLVFEGEGAKIVKDVRNIKLPKKGDDILAFQSNNPPDKAIRLSHNIIGSQQESYPEYHGYWAQPDDGNTDEDENNTIEDENNEIYGDDEDGDLSEPDACSSDDGNE
jgi:hypothetical protein